MIITLDQLRACTGASADRAAKWLPHLQDAMSRFGIHTPLRIAAFLANIGHESGGLRVLEEDLHYSAVGLANTWPARFAKKDPTGRPVRGADGRYEPGPQAQQLHRQPERIANVVYANRMGNGDEASGDGWKHRGMGPIQLTGKNNHRACGTDLAIDLVARPELLLTPEIGALAAGWFWRLNDINEHADRGDFDGVCDEINIGKKTVRVGDSHGFDERLALYHGGLRLLGWVSRPAA